VGVPTSTTGSDPGNGGRCDRRRSPLPSTQEPV
jgi:hypothetical protein